MRSNNCLLSKILYFVFEQILLFLIDRTNILNIVINTLSSSHYFHNSSSTITSSIEGQQDVLQLDVAMDDALGVQVAQPHQEAPGDLLLQLEALLASNHVTEIASRVKVKDQAVEVADRDDLV